MFDIITNTHNYISKRLEKAENAILKIAEETNKNSFKLAWIFADLNMEKSIDFTAEGFADLFEWAEKVFGLKKAQVYNYIRVGTDFVSEVKNGKTKYYQDSITVGEETHYTISQILQMLKYGYETAEEAHKASFISPEMSCREIKKNLEKFVNGAEETEAEETESEAEETEIITVSLWDSEGKEYRIPSEVLNKYAVSE